MLLSNPCPARLQGGGRRTSRCAGEGAWFRAVGLIPPPQHPSPIARACLCATSIKNGLRAIRCHKHAASGHVDGQSR